jgi:hypothetical protein
MPEDEEEGLDSDENTGVSFTQLRSHFVYDAEEEELVCDDNDEVEEDEFVSNLVFLPQYSAHSEYRK